MPILVKNRAIVTDVWKLYETIPDYLPTNAIVPYDELTNTQANAAWLDSDSEIEEIAPKLANLDLVAVYIAGFADGRALSLATLLRERYGFKGELRAIGEVLPDLTTFMLRCGFDAFELLDRQAAETAIQCMDSISGFYQGSVDEPQPAYRRVKRS